MSVGGLTTFNTNDGYVEAIVRGFRSGILSQSDYMNLTQCDVLDDIKVALAATDYGHFLQNEPSPLSTTVIAEKCTQKLVDEFNYLRAHCVEPLATFLDFITHGYMIDNVVLLLLGTINNRDLQELLDKCHPLGMFESMESVRIAQNPQELYNTILVDTPLAPYFLGAGKDWAPWSFDFTDISQQQYLVRGDDLGEVNIEIIRNRLYKNYLEQFYAYCQELGGTTAEVMGEILQFEADRRAINITINSFGTELSKDDRRNLFPTFGLLAPEGLTKLAAADDLDAVRNTMEYYAPYRAIFNDVGFNSDKSLEDAFFEHEVQLNKLSFMQQFHYGVFYSYLKLKEQEIRNIVWIAECVAQDRKQSIQQYIPIF